MIAINLTNGVQAAFKNSLDGISWIDEKSKQNTIHKLQNIIQIIGHPNKLDRWVYFKVAQLLTEISPKTRSRDKIGLKSGFGGVRIPLPISFVVFILFVLQFFFLHLLRWY